MICLLFESPHVRFLSITYYSFQDKDTNLKFGTDTQKIQFSSCLNFKTILLFNRKLVQNTSVCITCTYCDTFSVDIVEFESLSKTTIRRTTRISKEQYNWRQNNFLINQMVLKLHFSSFCKQKL